MFVELEPVTRLAAPVTAELDRAFERRDIADAIKLCFERDIAFVAEYMESAFSLAEPSNLQTDVSPSVGTHTAEGKGGSGAQIERDSGPDAIDIDLQAGIEPETGVVVDIANDGETQDDADFDDSSVSGEQGDDEIAEPTPLTKPKAPPKPSALTLIERFAQVQNFKRVGQRQFERADGALIVRTADGLFPWVRRSQQGEDLRYYLPIDECLQDGPVQVEAAAWAALESRPDAYCLLLRNRDGAPVETSGTALRRWLSEGALQVFAASYRVSLRQAQDDQAMSSNGGAPLTPSSPVP